MVLFVNCYVMFHCQMFNFVQLCKFCNCMSLLVCPGKKFILDSRWPIFGEEKLSFWLCCGPEF